MIRMNKNIKMYNIILSVIYSVTLCMSLLTISIAKCTPIPLSFISYSFGFIFFLITGHSWFLVYLLAFTITLIAGIISSLMNRKTIVFHLIIAIFCFIDLFIGGVILTTQIYKLTIHSIFGFTCLATDILLISFIIFVICKNTPKRND